MNYSSPEIFYNLLDIIKKCNLYFVFNNYETIDNREISLYCSYRIRPKTKNSCPCAPDVYFIELICLLHTVFPPIEAPGAKERVFLSKCTKFRIKHRKERQLKVRLFSLKTLGRASIGRGLLLEEIRYNFHCCILWVDRSF